MNTNNTFLTLLFFLTMLSQEASGMFSRVLTLCNRTPRKVKTALVITSIYIAGTIDDQRKGERLRFIDVSTPRKPMIVEDFNLAGKEFTQSVTRQQFMNDCYLMYHPVAAVYRCVNNMGSEYHELVDSVLFAHFWVFLPTLRKKLVNLVMNMSYNEAEQRKNDNVTLVSGTNQGASILLRTIFDEVFNDYSHQNFVELRDPSVVNALGHYQDINQYYDNNSFKAVILQGHRTPGSTFRSPDTMGVVLASKQASADTVSANFGFFGQSRDLIDGGQESSAEFITRDCSWGWQTIRCCALFLNAMIVDPFRICRIIENYASTRNLQVSLDRAGKQKLDPFFHDIFKEYGAEEQYQNYRDELQKLDVMMRAGILQLFITKENAQRWSYAAGRLGTRTLTDSEAIYRLETTNVRALPNHQVRILMHPDICNQKNTTMRFYVLGEPTEIRKAMNRMYQIAEEIKERR